MDSTERRETTVAQIENYLPGASAGNPGRVERFVTRLFRRRGEFGVVGRDQR